MSARGRRSGNPDGNLAHRARGERIRAGLRERLSDLADAGCRVPPMAQLGAGFGISAGRCHVHLHMLADSLGWSVWSTGFTPRRVVVRFPDGRRTF